MADPIPVLLLEALDAEAALNREWLCTNGVGGFAMGTVAGANTRRYHGLLVAALKPPLGRTLLCAKVDETFTVGAHTVHLGANEFHDGTRHPWGAPLLERFCLWGGRPTWRYRVPGGSLEKSVWMEYGENTTCVRYLSHGTGGMLRVAVFATYRDYHHHTRGSTAWQMEIRPTDSGTAVVAFPRAQPWYLIGPPGARFIPAQEWWWRFLHRCERERGLDDEEDLYLAGYLEVCLTREEPATVIFSTRPDAGRDGAWERQIRREEALIRRARAEGDPLLARLALAADQFLVARDSPPGEAGTILAGYPWFSDWGRDTMISLPGLTLPTGRHAEARRILTAYARYLDRGMLPNCFPDSGETPEYNTVDATLWFFEAAARYVRFTGDLSLVEELFPAFQEVAAWHCAGTRYGIGVDPADGLLRAGETGTQLTWMDARLGDWVVTPRRGKPVEVNALWINALLLLDGWSRRLGAPAVPPNARAETYRDLAMRAIQSFNTRFWCAPRRILFDVIDCPDGADDASLRPNQLMALSLTHPVLYPPRRASVMQAVERSLRVPVGVRTLAPDDPRYRGRYGGDPWQRDSAYHQGTAWPWLLGPYFEARRRQGATPAEIRAACQPL
ncbi:MAG: amylo-alpha-1,6-glucosidase, partial [Armatimonadota bacterium]|nr:amylo-alpha-1,6-glucosidase [Armatimonadota bacterium]